jgi:phage terminase large subunit
MQLAADTIRKWREDPVSMVVDLFGVQPDEWQVDALRAFPKSPRLAMRACAGPGKTAVLAWIAWNFLLTRPHPMIGATSVTRDNLEANLWAEMSRWKGKSKLLEAVFEQTGKAIYAKEHPETWRMEARGWARDADATAIGNALRGLHAPYIMWLLDETGDYPDSIMPVCENIFAGDPLEAHIVQAGNPSKLSGPLYRACVVAKALWHVITITGDPDDPKRSPRISLEHARAQIEQYGRDNPWVMVNLLGQFPPAAFNALIGVDEVEASMKRYYREDELRGSPKVLSGDVARQGDDQSVVAKRWGLQFMPLLKYRNIDGIQGAGVMSREWQEFGADACFIDATGGFGYTWIDQLRQLGRSPIPVEFAGKAHQSNRYFNKRAEMAFELLEWIRRGGALPKDDRLLQTLPRITYTFKGDKLMLAPKDLMKVELGFSPDEFDACITSFAQPVNPVASLIRRPNRSAVNTDYNPFANMGSNH